MDTVTLGTATPGGGFPVYGQALAETIAETDPTLTVQPQQHQGQHGERAPARGGPRSTSRWCRAKSPTRLSRASVGAPADLRILAAMYSTPGMFVARGDSEYRAIADLTGRQVAFGARGSGLVILARYVLDGLGLDQSRDFHPVFLDAAGDGPAMVLDGRVAALWGGGIGWPGFTAVARGPAGARFIVPDADGIRRILAKHAFLKPMTVPAGSYPGQSAAIASVGSWSFVMARPTLDDELAYRLARALHRGEAALGARLAQARETTAANTVAAAPRAELIHPGARRYLREIGLLRG